MTTYCDVARGHEFHAPYHDTEYGFPLASDDLLFERLIVLLGDIVTQTLFAGKMSHPHLITKLKAHGCAIDR